MHTCLSAEALRTLVCDVLIAQNTAPGNARQVARAVVAAEIDGQPGHGVSRVPFYAAQSHNGKIDGHALPVSEQIGTTSLRVDARCGFAYPALNVAVTELAPLAQGHGIAAAAMTNSHHTGVVGHIVESLADKGLVGLYFGNGPQAISPWGGTRGLFGTNPIAFAAPRGNGEHLLIDMSLSKVARGKVNLAAQNGEAIPEGWALDANGQPTTDPRAAMDGTMLPMGDAKGAQLVLMVEILAAALTGSNFGYEASSFFTDTGDPPRAGQLLIALNPAPFSGARFASRLEDLLVAILDQPGTRLPGARRFERRERAHREGISLPRKLHDELLSLCEAR